MNKYDVVKTIGEGAYGVVLQCRNKETNELVAIKRFKESDEDELVRKTTLREVRILRMLKDEPYVVRLQEAFRRKGKLYLVFDYVGCNLLDVLEQNPQGLPTDDIRRMVFTMLLGIRACHANGVIHRDIKPENLLVHEDNTLRLCDFGFARVYTKGMDDLTDYVATRWYRSPELLLGTSDYGLPSDIWAVGCIMAELIDGQAIFPCETEVDQIFVIQKLLGNFTPQQMEVFRKNPRFNGYTLKEIAKPESSFERKFMKKASKKALSLLKAMLVIDPTKRCSVDEALSHPFFEGLAEIYYPTLLSNATSPPQNSARPTSGAAHSIASANNTASTTKIPALARPPSSLSHAKQQQEQYPPPHRVGTPSESSANPHQHQQHPLGFGEATSTSHWRGQGTGLSDHEANPLEASGGGGLVGLGVGHGLGGMRGPSPWSSNAASIANNVTAPTAGRQGIGGGTILPPARITSANRMNLTNMMIGAGNVSSSEVGGGGVGIARIGTPGIHHASPIIGGGGGGGYSSHTSSSALLGPQPPSVLASAGSGGGMGMGLGGGGGGHGSGSGFSNANQSSVATTAGSNPGSFTGRARLPNATAQGNLPRINFAAGLQQYEQQQQSSHQSQLPQPPQAPTMVVAPPPSAPNVGVYGSIPAQSSYAHPQGGGTSHPTMGLGSRPSLGGGGGGVGATQSYYVNGGQLPPRTGGGGVYSTGGGGMGGGVVGGGYQSIPDPFKYNNHPPTPQSTAGTGVGSAGAYRTRMY